MTEQPPPPAPPTPSAREPSQRLFVGVRVSLQTANAIGAAAQTLARRAREAQLDLKWVPPANYHATLKFLGQTRTSAVGAIVDGLTAACAGTAPFQIQVGRVGAFPTLEKARVIWAGIEDGGALTALAGVVDRACAALGYASETRTFHPHVTIARARESRPLNGVVLPIAEQMFGGTRVDAISLFESVTDSKGSVYRELQRIPFKLTRSALEMPSERQSGAVQLGATNREPVDIDTDDGWPRGHGPADS